MTWRNKRSGETSEGQDQGEKYSIDSNYIADGICPDDRAYVSV